MWQIIWDPPATRRFDNLPEAVREDLYAALLRLVARGEGDVQRLKGPFAGTYRLRVGRYRVRFELHPGDNVLLILSVDPRGRAYRH